MGTDDIDVEAWRALPEAERIATFLKIRAAAHAQTLALEELRLEKMREHAKQDARLDRLELELIQAREALAELAENESRTRAVLAGMGGALETLSDACPGVGVDDDIYVGPRGESRGPSCRTRKAVMGAAAAADVTGLVTLNLWADTPHNVAGTVLALAGVGAWHLIRRR